MSRFWITTLTVLQCCAIIFSQDQVAAANDSQTTASPALPKCGIPNPGALTFRFQDGYADFGEYPWMAAILKKSNESSGQWQQKDYVAAGSIIHPSAVLTTAHWIGNLTPEEIKSRAGEWDTSSEDEIYLHQERNVKKIMMHPDYVSDSLSNDLALLILEEPYEFASAPNLGSACISQTAPAAGIDCFSMGWGLGANNPNNVLKKLKAKTLSRDECEEQMRKTRLGDSFQLHESFLCVSSTDNCEGDTGASLVCPIEGEISRFALNGVSAYRISETGAPCLYVNTPLQYNWIGEKMTEEGLTSSYFTI